MFDEFYSVKETAAILAHHNMNEDIDRNSIKRSWRDEDGILCIEYNNGQWWHYNDAGEWW